MLLLQFPSLSMLILPKKLIKGAQRLLLLFKNPLKVLLWYRCQLRKISVRLIQFHGILLLEVCYLIGAPTETDPNKLLELFRSLDIPQPSDWNAVTVRDSYGINCRYVKMDFEDEKDQTSQEKIVKLLR
jgi:hypothetical protein